jgi:hypothetical protein
VVDFVQTSSTGRGMDKVREDLLRLMKTDVLVGIPEDESLRKESNKINNAQLLYIHTNGSDLQHIPSRPVIEPAIKANQDKLNELLKEAAKLVLSGQTEQSKIKLKEAGMLGADVSREWFTDPRNGWPPNSPETILRKLEKSKDVSLRRVVKYVKKGGSLSKVTGLEGATNPLIDTSQMRKAITFVLREK